jgi:hydroxymethylglutaryl-CoA reductase (NADPH)
MYRNLTKLLKNLKPYMYENALLSQNVPITNAVLEECVIKRREYYGIDKLPFEGYNYMQSLNHNCENVVGYIRIPTGVIGPIHGKHIPFATTEGALISSINRGCKLLNKSETNIIVEDVGMTRSPIVKCNSLDEVKEVKDWIHENYGQIKDRFESETNYTKLQKIDFLQEGRHLHIRFCATTGDAMGMNMISKSTNNVLQYLQSRFGIKVIALSGNTCTDKKASAINLIKGRGKRVTMDATINQHNLMDILKVTPNQLINLNIQKNMIGSSLAGTIGGNNCNASNVVAGLFLSLGQDSAQIGTSSYCMINMDFEEGNLLVTINMPCLEVGTIGGGTRLDDQYNNLQLLGVNDDNPPGENAMLVARTIIYSVLSCELSLMAALCNDDLVKAHMKLNRGVIKHEKRIPWVVP